MRMGIIGVCAAQLACGVAANVAPQIDAGTEVDAGRPDAGSRMVQAVALASPPTYVGSKDNGACETTYRTAGFHPSTGTRWPLFLYFVGTRVVANDPGSAHDSPAPMAVANAMARRGFFALSVEYDNGLAPNLTNRANQLRCLFDVKTTRSLLATVCAREDVDCDAGIATWGHSQGAAVAVKAANIDSRVKVAWATGFSGDGSAVLARDRLRVVNGETDPINNQRGVLNGATGRDCATGDVCLGPKGSGWVLVRKAALATVDGVAPSADHCWFSQRSCPSPILLEPTWVDGAAPHGLEPNADWVAERLRAP